MWTRARSSRRYRDDTEHVTRTRPPEPPDSLTPLSELTQPIDPDAADRRRYVATDEAEYPRLRIIGRAGAPPRTDRCRGTAPRLRRGRTRRLTVLLTATRHYGNPFARAASRRWVVCALSVRTSSAYQSA